jgi:hypothetical protein
MRPSRATSTGHHDGELDRRRRANELLMGGNARTHGMGPRDASAWAADGGSLVAQDDRLGGRSRIEETVETKTELGTV